MSGSLYVKGEQVMNDTQSFREVVEAEVEETPTEQPKEEPKVELKDEPKEEPREAKEEQSPDTETFAEKGDLSKKTPEELEEIYKNWNKAYTTKRQKETQELKEYRAKLVKLEEQLKNQPQAQPSQNIEQKKGEAQQALNLGQMSVEQYTEYINQLNADKAREIAREEYQSMISQEREQELASNAVEKFKSADPRLNDVSPEFDEGFRNEVQRELAELLDQHLEESGSYKGFESEALTKKIVERRDKELDEIIKKRTIQSTQAAKMREAKAKKAEIRGTSSSGQPIGGNSIRDILSEAVETA